MDIDTFGWIGYVDMSLEGFVFGLNFTIQIAHGRGKRFGNFEA